MPEAPKKRTRKPAEKPTVVADPVVAVQPAAPPQAHHRLSRWIQFDAMLDSILK